MKNSSFSLTTLILLALGAACVVAGALFLGSAGVRGDAEGSDAKPAREPRSVARAPDGVSAAAATDAGSAAAAGAPVPRASPLVTSLAQASDLRVFAEAARSRPLDGGLFYEQIAVGRCQEVRQVEAEGASAPRAGVDHKAAFAQQEASRRLSALCASFIAGELDVRRFADAAYRQQAVSARDPLLAARQRVLDAGTDPAKRAAAIRDAISTQDPLLLQQVGLGLTETGMYFSGKQFAPGKEMQLYSAALSLSACDLGDRCDANDFFVVRGCAVEGICAGSREELALALLRRDYALDQAQLSLVRALRTEMTTAMRSKNSDAFLPPPATGK